MISSGLFSEHQQLPPISRGLQEVYAQYAQSCSSSIAAGCQCLSIAHLSLQEHALRFEADAAHGHLRAVLCAVVTLLGSYVPLDTQSEPQRSSTSTTFLALSGIYCPTEDDLGRPRSSTPLEGVDVMQWYEEALRALTDGRCGEQSPVNDPLSCPPSLYLPWSGSSSDLYPSIRLTRSFFDYLNARVSEDAPACTPYKLLLDAYVHCVHGAHKIAEDTIDNSSADWIMMSSCFPFLIRMYLDLSLQQCADDPNPSWPPYLLMLVGRDDLCGMAVPVAD